MASNAELLNKWLVRYNELIRMDRTHEAKQVLRCINDVKNAALAPAAAPEAGERITKPCRVAGRDFMPGDLVQQVIGRAEAHYNVQHETFQSSAAPAQAQAVAEGGDWPTVAEMRACMVSGALADFGQLYRWVSSIESLISAAIRFRESCFRSDGSLMAPTMPALEKLNLAIYATASVTDASDVAELIESHKASVAEIERLRGAMFDVYATAHNDGDVIAAVERMRNTMDMPWSVDRSRTAIAAHQQRGK